MKPKKRSERAKLLRAAGAVHTSCMVPWRRWGASGYPLTSEAGKASHKCLNEATMARGFAYEGKLAEARKHLDTAKALLRAAKRR